MNQSVTYEQNSNAVQHTHTNTHAQVHTQIHALQSHKCTYTDTFTLTLINIQANITSLCILCDYETWFIKENLTKY